MSDRCRSCNAPIRWAETRKGRRMPLDPEPADDGNIVIVREVVTGSLRRDIADVLTTAQLADLSPDRLRYSSHFRSCPASERHRRRR